MCSWCGWENTSIELRAAWSIHTRTTYKIVIFWPTNGDLGRTYTGLSWTCFTSGVAICIRNSRTRFSPVRECVADFTVMYRNEPKAELYARVTQLVEHHACKQGIVGSIHSPTPPILLMYILCS